jgi:signal transduction histidine kinase
MRSPLACDGYRFMGSDSNGAHARIFPALHEIAVALGGVVEPVALARLVVQHARELLEAGAVGLYVFDEASRLLRPLHSSDARDGVPEPEIEPGQGAAGQAFLRGEPILVDDYPNWTHAGGWAQANGVRAALAVPLQVADRRTGALAVRTYEPRQWTAQDAQTLTLLAAQVAPALETAHLFERTREAQRQAEAAIKQRDEVLAGVTHDLAGPLARIRLYAELVQAEAAALETADIASQMVAWGERIVAATSSMSNIIQELLDVARLQMGRGLQLNCRQVELVELVRRCIAERYQVDPRLRFDPSSGQIRGWWDDARLSRVLGNLMDNAIKYSSPDGVVVVDVARDAERGGWALLTVRDGGVGIPPGELQRVLEPFYRGSNVVDHSTGSGIGLAVARHIVEQHGGSLTIDSRLGVGTLAIVRLPCVGLDGRIDDF